MPKCLIIQRILVQFGSPIFSLLLSAIQVDFIKGKVEIKDYTEIS